MFLAAVSAVVLASDPQPSAFYFHDTVGFGAWIATSQYKGATPTSPPGTRDIQGFGLSVASTLGFRASDVFAVGAQIHGGFLPFVNGTENRSRGFRPLPGIPFGLHLTAGPAFVLLPGNFRFDVSPGALFILTGPESGHGSPAFGGYGGGVSVGAGYDVPLSPVVALAIELRLSTGVHVNSDSTHLQGYDFGLALMAGIRRR